MLSLLQELMIFFGLSNKKSYASSMTQIKEEQVIF